MALKMNRRQGMKRRLRNTFRIQHLGHKNPYLLNNSLTPFSDINIEIKRVVKMYFIFDYSDDTKIACT